MGCCNAIDSHFGDAHAERDLGSYHKKGPDATTRFLIQAVYEAKVEDAHLLDIGAGVGVLQHELLKGPVSFVAHVDASDSYIKTARGECERRGNSARVKFVSGDFTDIYPNLDDVDIVLLDRVLCCYPEFRELVTRSVEKSRLLYGISYPRDHLLARTAFFLDNMKRKICGNAFRAFVHSNKEVETLITSSGFILENEYHTLIWRIAVFRKKEDLSSS